MPLYELGMGPEKIHVVLDIGTYHTKIGFAGESSPRHIIRSYNVKNNNTIVNICDPTLTQQQLQDELIVFVHSIYFRYLLVNPKDRKVVICEDFAENSKFRSVLADVLFKQFSVVGILMTPSLSLALVPLGSPTGLVINVGYMDTSVLCVYEGMALIKSYKYVELGTYAHLIAIQEMVSENGEVKIGDETKKVADVYGKLKLSELEDIRARCCFCGERPTELADIGFSKSGRYTDHRAVGMNYPLSNGFHLNVSGKIRERSVEVLYDGDGDDNSIATVALDSLLSAPIDCRVELAERILVIGGGSMLPGFTHRLKQELLAMLDLPRYKDLPITKFKFYKPNYSNNIMSWLGGAIMGSVEQLQERYISREFYYQRGEATLPDWSSLQPPIRDMTPSTPMRRTSSHLRDFMSSPTLPPLSSLSIK